MLKIKETYLTDLEIILENLKLTNNKSYEYLDCVIKCIKNDNKIS